MQILDRFQLVTVTVTLMGPLHQYVLSEFHAFLYTVHTLKYSLFCLNTDNTVISFIKLLKNICLLKSS